MVMIEGNSSDMMMIVRVCICDYGVLLGRILLFVVDGGIFVGCGFGDFV